MGSSSVGFFGARQHQSAEKAWEIGTPSPQPSARTVEMRSACSATFLTDTTRIPSAMNQRAGQEDAPVAGQIARGTMLEKKLTKKETGCDFAAMYR